MTIQIHESQPTEAAPEWPKVMKSADGYIYIFPSSENMGIWFGRGTVGKACKYSDISNASLTPITGPVAITITP